MFSLNFFTPKKCQTSPNVKFRRICSNWQQELTNETTLLFLLIDFLTSLCNYLVHIILNKENVLINVW